MNPRTFEGAIDAAKDALSRVPGVRSLVLYGSAARGSATEDSDIDLLIDCDRSAEREAWHVLNELDDRFHVRFSPMFFRVEEWHRFDTQYLESILRHGHVLFGKMPALTPIDLDLQPLRLVSYQTDRLSPRKRARLLRAIDGYRSAKRVGRKRYVAGKPGFLHETGGWRVGRGAVVIPEESVPAFDELLRRYHVTRSMVPIWSQRP